MGFRISKSVKLGKGVRLSLTKTGIGISAGIPGLRYSAHSSGRRVKTVGLPGTGLYYRKDSNVKGGSSRARSTRAPIPTSPTYPKAGLLAPKAEKIFVQGVTAYMQGRFGDALAAFRHVQARDAGQQHVAEEFFAALCLVGLDQLTEAIHYLEIVLASDFSIPDPLMTKYGVGGSMVISVTPALDVTVPMSNLSVALLLAEAYQRTEQRDRAIELLESLGAAGPGQPAFALALAELYFEDERWEEVARVTEGGQTNEGDMTLGLLNYRAFALNELGLHDAALALTKEGLKSRKRSAGLLRETRYIRGRAYESTGKKTLAQKEYERVYAEQVDYADVAHRLGRDASIVASPAAPRPD
jgi:tetratricopeptide (TPR) repeat protein